MPRERSAFEDSINANKTNLGFSIFMLVGHFGNSAGSVLHHHVVVLSQFGTDTNSLPKPWKLVISKLNSRAERAIYRGIVVYALRCQTFLICCG